MKLVARTHITPTVSYQRENLCSCGWRWRAEEEVGWFEGGERGCVEGQTNRCTEEEAVMEGEVSGGRGEYGSCTREDPWPSTGFSERNQETNIRQNLALCVCVMTITCFHNTSLTTDYIYICVRARVCVCVCVWSCVRTYICVCFCACISACVCVCMCLC